VEEVNESLPQETGQGRRQAVIEFILDTDVLTLIQEGHPEIGRRFLGQSPDTVAITVLSVEVQLSGWYTQLRRAKRPERLAWAYRRMAETIRFLSRLQLLTYDENAMQRFEKLRKRKIKIGRTDLGIAAIVLEHDATLVTENKNDFERVPGLKFSSWSGP
jgi:tRNA(fMet)-specific endonuclease VapC